MDIILLDSSTKTKEEINIIKPKTYKKLLKKLEEEFEELPENYELFILDKTNKEIKISKESDFKKIGDILFVREIIKDNLDKSLYELNYNKLSESKQEILDDKYNCIFTGFGGKLFIDKKIYEEFYKNAKELSDQYEMPFENDTFNEHFIYGYWLTIARDMFK